MFLAVGIYPILSLSLEIFTISIISTLFRHIQQKGFDFWRMKSSQLVSSDVKKIDVNIMLIYRHVLLLPPLYLFPKHRMFQNIVSDNPMKIIILQKLFYLYFSRS